MATFYRDQKVVCVDARSGIGIWRSEEEPIEGQIYTVRRCFITELGNEVVWLNEIARCAAARYQWGDDVGYGVYRFRPLCERKTDISIFTAMLNNQRALEPV